MNVSATCDPITVQPCHLDPPHIYPQEGGYFTIGGNGDGATLWYTTNGQDPANSSSDRQYFYAGKAPFRVVGEGTIIRAVAVNVGCTNSEEVTYEVGCAAADPTININEADGTVTISCTGTYNAIYYTIDGSDPLTDGIAYTDPFTVQRGTVVKAYATREDCDRSDVVSETYCIIMNAPVVSIAEGQVSTWSWTESDYVYVNDYVLTITTPVTGGTIYYKYSANPIGDDWIANFDPDDYTTYTSTSTSGRVIGLEADYICSDCHEDREPVYIKAVVVKDGCVSPVGEGHICYAPAPSIDIDCSTLQCTITPVEGTSSVRYTTDGTTPSAENGDTYSAPFTVTAETTVKAVALSSNSTCGPSEVVSASRPPLTTPSISIGYDSDERDYYFIITCETPGVTIYYEINDSGWPSDPNRNSEEAEDGTTNWCLDECYDCYRYDSVYIKAIAVTEDGCSSAVGTAQYPEP